MNNFETKVKELAFCAIEEMRRICAYETAKKIEAAMKYESCTKLLNMIAREYSKRSNTEITIEKNARYHLYTHNGLYFVDYYDGKPMYGYDTEAAAREAIRYHFE